MDPTYVANLHTLLAQSVAPDTNVIKSATAALNQNYYKDPACIPALYEIIATSSEQNVRQLAAVELRKRVSQGEGKLWKDVPQDVRQAIKAKIFENILAEPASIVRHAMARVIEAIAEIELPLHTWPELLPWCNQAASSSAIVHREVGTFVLFSVTEQIMDSVKEHSGALFLILTQLLRDPESPTVRMTAVRALGSFAQFIEPDDKPSIKRFQTELPAIMHVIAQASEQNNEDDARHGFDVIETLLIIETPLLAKNIPDLIQFCLGVGANKNIDDEIRQMALNCLTWTIKYKKAKIQSLNLAKPMMEILLPIGSEADPEDNDEDSPSRLAFRAIDTLATVLPPTQVFPPLLELVSTYMQSTDPGLRKAAMMAFGVTVEGCSEFIRPHMKSLWPLIDSGLMDPEWLVRKAACMAFACICEWLEEDCAERHAVLLPVLVQLTEDPNTQGAACTALDAYLEILEEQIGNYLPMIMQRLSGLLATAPIKIRLSVIGAIGSAAHASKERFIPYFEESMKLLMPFLLLTTEGDELDLRGIALDALGTFAEAVGRDVYRPYVADLMKSSLDGVTLNNARLKECTFLFFGVVATVFRDEFNPYVPAVVPLLLESMRQAEGGADELLAAAEEAFSTGALDAKEIMAEMLDTDLAPGEAKVVDIDTSTAINTGSAVAIEKEIAADAMGTIATATGEQFVPYLGECVDELVEALAHYYEGIRKSAISSLIGFVETFYTLSNPPLWEPGASVPVPLHEKVKEFVVLVIPPIMKLWESEDDRSVVSSLCQALSTSLPKVGPGLIDGYIEALCTHLTEILEGKSLCQQDPDADEDDEPLEDQAEFEIVLICAAMDVVTSVATILGADFVQPFVTFLPLIAKNTQPQKQIQVRAAAIGTIGDIISSLKGAVTPFTPTILEVTFASLSDEEVEIRSNAAFAIGVIIENSDEDISANQHFMHILNALKPLFHVTEASTSTETHARDNAVGAVSRMILKNSDALPLDQVLPVLYGALPLKNDYLENPPLYRGIFHLFRTNEAMMMNYVDVLVPAFAQVLAPDAKDQLPDDVRLELIQLIQHLKTTAPAKVAPLAPLVPGL